MKNIYLIISLCLFSLNFIFLNQSFAGSKYNLTLTNNANLPVRVKMVNFHCIGYFKDLPRTIQSHSSYTLIFTDDGNQNNGYISGGHNYGEDDGSHMHSNDEVIEGMVTGTIKNADFDKCEGHSKYTVLDYEILNADGSHQSPEKHDLINWSYALFNFSYSNFISK